MASTPDYPEATLDVRKQIARIDQILASTTKTRQETRFAPWAIVFTGLGAGAALFAAGAAFMKILIG